MTNINDKLQVVRESLNQVEGNITLREYVENEKQSDPGFMRWLLSDDNLSDFGSNVTDEQETEYQEFLSKL